MWRSFLMLLMFGSSAFASEPVFDAIDYGKPAKYLTSPSSLGDQKAIAAQALTFKADRDSKTVLHVLNWMQANLKYQADLAYHWRNYDTVIREGCYGGCADYAIVCGVLLQQAGIPTVWVKTMDVPWIWDLKKGRPFRTWSGHVYLEIYIDKKWVLLDPGAKKIYVDYSPQARILPGNRFAYHKGNDPKEMVMSLQWEAWKRQTEKYFSQLDESLLPINTVTAETLGPKCFVIGNTPYYQVLTKSAQEKGMVVVKSFNSQYGIYLPLAKSHTLYIQTQNGTPIVPIATLEKYFPNASDGLQAGSISVGDTKIVFFDFLKEKGSEEKQKTFLANRPKCFVIGNSPYYQMLTKLAQDKGMNVVKSFNAKYNKYLPQAKGHTLYIQTQNGIPIVPISKLEKYFPKASDGLKTGSITVDETTILFTDFSKATTLEEKRKQLLREKAKLNTQ